MATRQLGDVLRHLCSVLDAAGPTDGQLLERFLERHDDAAFAALVNRHGPMVLGVCQRVLNHSHDAEDAFQVTFLVLARKAASIVPRENVSNWLHGVAYNTALKAKAAAARRRTALQQVRHLQRPQSSPPEVWQDLQPLLDRELKRLPEKYRLPVVLCDLEGLTRKDAAQRLGWPMGTVSGRLVRARRILAMRLARHGLMVSGGALATTLCQNASAGVPAALAAAAVRAALLVATNGSAAKLGANLSSLLEGVLKTMLLAKLKVAAAMILAFGVAGAAVVVLTLPPAADARRETTEKTAIQELPVPLTLPETPSARDLVAHLNDNARKVQTLRCADIDVDFQKRLQAFSVRAMLAYWRPGQFRFMADVFGNREMDIGSNTKEYWAWMKHSLPMLLCDGLYRTPGRAKISLMLPDCLLEVLGLAEQAVPSTYEISVRPKTIEFRQQATYLGLEARKVIVFNRSPNAIPVAGYRLEDATGKMVYGATIKGIHRDRSSGADLPNRLEILYPEEGITIKVRLEEIKVNSPFDQDRPATLFARPVLPGE
jgi:RNA polymerase sigma factor (sigma-70 family)